VVVANLGDLFSRDAMRGYWRQRLHRVIGEFEQALAETENIARQ
jgi:glutaredoxin 2